MPTRFCATLLDNRVLAPHTFVLSLSGCAPLADTAPGQFVMMAGADWGNDPLLPRAFSLLAVHRDPDAGDVCADVLVKTTGKASALLERALPGARFWLLGPLGRAFPAPDGARRDCPSDGARRDCPSDGARRDCPSDGARRDWLIAGGVGLAPLYMQAVAAARAGAADRVTVFYGGRTAADLVMLDELRATGAALVLATEDGSVGTRGFVTAAVDAALSSESSAAAPPTLMACGPDPMLHAVARLAHRRGVPAYLSLEGEMACGIGACLACAVPCASKPYRYTCVDGPVFDLCDLAGPYAPAGSAPPVASDAVGSCPA